MSNPLGKLVKKIAHKDQYFWTLITAFILISIPFTVYTAQIVRDLRSRAALSFLDSPCYNISSGVYKKIDVTGDYYLNTDDVNAVTAHYYSNYDPAYDLNSDGRVDAIDQLIVITKIPTTPRCVPVISYFEVSPSNITSGQAVTVTWSTQFATSATLNGVSVGSTPLHGTYSRTYYPTTTTPYTIRADNPLGASYTASTSWTVYVSSPPPPPPAPTVSIWADSTNISYNTSTTIHWSSTNATGCTASNGWSGSKSTSGSQSTGNLTSLRTYTLTCTGSGGTKSNSVTVNVSAAPLPNLSFSASPGSITSGQSSTLSWTSSNATTVTINNGVGTVAVNGTKVVSPTSSITYLATATGLGGSVSKSTSITVNGVPPPVVVVPPPSVSPPPPAVTSPPPSGSKPSSGSKPQGSSGNSPPAGQPASQIGVVTGKNDFLIGSRELTATVEGTNVYKKFLIHSGSEEISIDTSALTAGQTYNLKIAGEWVISQNISFAFSPNQKLNMGLLIIGDLNQTGNIDDSDVFEFLNGFNGDKFYDLNSDGVVNSVDYSILVGNMESK
ncbi:MAG: hypothetical protein A3F35_00210 [Candidatus Woykebacteria bacterium RIFCSPHIGHO2_12_FULL_45_10]|uniref:Dockerin domain-containing protein n=1 Tax=Candidatus Woykebacteria bacterium RIFCSPHIGHO2_12_FULL_45_10 TaxID=1802603 RepID=A0A1G1WPR7_9BACT|nr:MAG: hypothetical protein A3F35_00210 [Candidatus Woykebacteria bacterium RIFCSPHIGHO2_12_FULL_45_10]